MSEWLLVLDPITPEAKAAQIEAAWALYDERGRRRGPIALALAHRLSAEQNHRCCHCGVRTKRWDRGPHRATVEHIIPRCRGGSNEYRNLAMACYSCNNARGSRIMWRPVPFGRGRVGNA